jgi:hypothetical protein
MGQARQEREMPHWNPLLEGDRVDLHPRVIFLQPLGAIGWLLHRSNRRNGKLPGPELGESGHQARIAFPTRPRCGLTPGLQPGSDSTRRGLTPGVCTILLAPEALTGWRPIPFHHLQVYFPYDWPQAARFPWPSGRPMPVGSVHPSVLALTSQCEVLHTVSVMSVMFPFLAHRLSWT